MKYEIVNLDDISGRGCTFYSIIYEGEEVTEYDKFLDSYEEEFPDEINSIQNRLDFMGEKGAREIFFTLYEGKPGDLTCALYDEEEKNLRLYCMRFGNSAVIIGGGGYKSKQTRRWEDDEVLKKEMEKMISLSKNILERLKDKSIYWADDGCELLGDLTMEDYE